jgi:uncharacterized membrane protein YphA (DoxX/SURF4 family)
MATLKNLEIWGDTHHPRWLDLIRIALGVFIFWKAVFFIQNPEVLYGIMKTVHLEFLAAHIVIPLHLFGGLLIAVGLITRIASLVQLPIAGAALAATIISGTMGFEFWSSLIVLLLLILFLIVGSGKWSLEYYLRDPEEEKRETS